MQRHPEVDAVIVGTGWAGSVIAQQLTEAGLDVVALEHGRSQWTYPDFAHNHDELKYRVRWELMKDLSRDTITWRPDPAAPSLPLREFGNHLAGGILGGAGVHWAANSWRYPPSDFPARSRLVDRYGASRIPDDITIQDWPLSYDDLEPFYDRFEYDVGVSGVAGNLGGQIMPEGNRIEGPRSRPFPLPPLEQTAPTLMFAEAGRQLGHHAFPAPAAILSRGYTDLSGQPRAGCLYCGFCMSYGCEVDAKASPLVTHLPLAFATGRYEVRTHSKAVGIEVDDRGRGVGLRYRDRSGREHLQPAARIFLAAWTFGNVRLLLLSRSSSHPDGVGNNHGLVGRNYTDTMNQGAVTATFEGRRFNLFMGNTANRHAIATYYGDEWDHSDVDFLGGGWFTGGTADQSPIDTLGELPMLTEEASDWRPGAGGAEGAQNESGSGGPRQWGEGYKDALYDAFNSTLTFSLVGDNMAHEGSFLDLDPVYTDSYGLPLLRMTRDWSDLDARKYRYLTGKLAEIVEAMNPSWMNVTEELPPFGIADGDNHPSGGAIMGDSPQSSVTNQYGQVWDAPNVFVTGGALFPQKPGFNPAETIAALAYRTADAVKRHRDSPDGLMG